MNSASGLHFPDQRNKRYRGGGSPHAKKVSPCIQTAPSLIQLSSAETLLARDGILGHHFGYSQSNYLRIFQKTRLFSGFKIPSKISTKQENSSLFVSSILQKWKMMVEKQTKTLVWKDSSLSLEMSSNNAVQEFWLWLYGLVLFLWPPSLLFLSISNQKRHSLRFFSYLKKKRMTTLQKMYIA
jgi:hypothetical protein